MYMNKKIGVTVPAHNEEKFVGEVIDTIPDFVDNIYVVNDASTDRTAEIITQKAKQNNKVTVINHDVKRGVGGAVLAGHIRALNEGMAVLVVMAGDGQMDPAFLPDIIAPVVEGKADYTKGDRLSNRAHRKEMPPWRLMGNLLLTNLTRLASGYRNIFDPQNGYTAISADTLKKINIDKIERGFAFENDMLVKLNVVGARVMDVQHPAVYRGQNSKIHYSEFIIRTSWILLKDGVWHLWVKYLRKANHEAVREEIKSG